MPGNPVIVFFFARAFQLMIVIPVSWLLYQQQKGESDSPGTGLANVRARLKLIYPGRHWFKAGPSENLYISQLIVQLL
jgi:LytS/YehU family sensor histidine kinase